MTGAIVLAAFEPDAELFARQLRSIKAQTVSDFRCIITADGSAVASLVRDAVADDPRFAVIGFDDRVGFYANFERGLAAVPADAEWVALSDQDDYWYPGKLATLLPGLATAALVSGQARVVAHPSGEVLAESTTRHAVPLDELVVQNQVSGALAVFRRELLETALPFPVLHSWAALHDHWLAVCAGATGGIRFVDDVVQDYVQHDANVVGETGRGPLAAVDALLRRARQYEGDGVRRRDLPGVLAKHVAGWRELMVATLAVRVGGGGPTVRSRFGTVRFVASGVLRRRFGAQGAVTYLVGTLARPRANQRDQSRE